MIFQCMWRFYQLILGRRSFNDNFAASSFIHFGVNLRKQTFNTSSRIAVQFVAGIGWSGIIGGGAGVDAPNNVGWPENYGRDNFVEPIQKWLAGLQGDAGVLSQYQLVGAAVCVLVQPFHQVCHAQDHTVEIIFGGNTKPNQCSRLKLFPFVEFLTVALQERWQKMTELQRTIGIFIPWSIGQYQKRDLFLHLPNLFKTLGRSCNRHDTAMWSFCERHTASNTIEAISTCTSIGNYVWRHKRSSLLAKL